MDFEFNIMSHLHKKIQLGRANQESGYVVIRFKAPRNIRNRSYNAPCSLLISYAKYRTEIRINMPEVLVFSGPALPLLDMANDMKPDGWNLHIRTADSTEEEVTAAAEVADFILVFEHEQIDPNNPLLKMDNVSVTNHYASYSELAWQRANTQLGEESMRIALGYWPMSLINPDVRSTVEPRNWAVSWEVMLTEQGK